MPRRKFIYLIGLIVLASQSWAGTKPTCSDEHNQSLLKTIFKIGSFPKLQKSSKQGDACKVYSAITNHIYRTFRLHGKAYQNHFSNNECLNIITNLRQINKNDANPINMDWMNLINRGNCWYVMWIFSNTLTGKDTSTGGIQFLKTPIKKDPRCELGSDKTIESINKLGNVIHAQKLKQIESNQCKRQALIAGAVFFSYHLHEKKYRKMFSTAQCSQMVISLIEEKFSFQNFRSSNVLRNIINPENCWNFFQLGSQSVVKSMQQIDNMSRKKPKTPALKSMTISSHEATQTSKPNQIPKSAAPITRTPRSIQLRLSKKQSVFDRIYRRALRSDPQLHGTITFKFKLDTQGRIHQMNTITKIKNKTFVKKVERAFRSTKFDRSDKVESFVYPLTFKPE